MPRALIRLPFRCFDVFLSVCCAIKLEFWGKFNWDRRRGWRRKDICCEFVIAVLEAAHYHVWVSLEDGILSYRIPMMCGSDRLCEALRVVLVKESRFDACCVVRRRNGWVIVILKGQRDADGISRFCLNLGEDVLEILCRCWVPFAVWQLFFFRWGGLFCFLWCC